MNKTNKYQKELKIGIISNRLDSAKAYKKNGPPIVQDEEYEARREIREGLRQLGRCNDKPDIILAPEVSIPRGFLKELKLHACKLGALCVFGIDYKIEGKGKSKTAKNEIVVVIPERWPRKTYSRKVYVFSTYKTYFPKTEKSELIKHGVKPLSDQRLWLFDAGIYGCFGIANCYDFLDIERQLLYKSKIHHLFVLSYNKDTTSFIHTAESLARTMFCNVVICNTGFYGGSVVVSPYRKSHKRIVFQHMGGRLFSTQLIKVQVKALAEQWEHDYSPKRTEFKALPPGFGVKARASNRRKTIVVPISKL